MTDAEHDALERLFEQEIAAALREGALPVKLKKRTADRLIERGWIAPCTFTLGRDAFGPIEVPGHELTHLGRLEYCATCADVEDEGDGKGAD